MAIVNLRGTNGSGKSTIAHKLIDKGAVEITLVPETENHKRIVGYMTYVGAVVVGPYRTQCGGCDAIPTQDLVCNAVRSAAKKSSNVLFEGLLVSGIYARYQALSEELRAQGHRFVWGILTTPLEESLRRVYTRNGGKPIKEELVANKLRGVESAARKARAAGEVVVDIPWKRPWGAVWKHLQD